MKNVKNMEVRIPIENIKKYLLWLKNINKKIKSEVIDERMCYLKEKIIDKHSNYF